MTLAVYQFFDPHTIQTSSSVAALSFYRSDLTNTVTLTQSSANTLTCSGGIVATSFSGTTSAMRGTHSNLLITTNGSSVGINISYNQLVLMNNSNVPYLAPFVSPYVPINCATTTVGVSGLDSSVTQTCSVSSASPAVVTLANHGYSANSAVVFVAPVPSGIAAGTTYYVMFTGLGQNTFQISATQGGAAINTTTSTSPTITSVMTYSCWYALYIMYNGTTVAAILSSSFYQPNLPSGYTYYARIGSIYIQSATSYNPLAMRQQDNTAHFVVSGSGNMTALPQNSTGVQGSTTTPTTISVTPIIPPTARTAIMLAATSGTGTFLLEANQYGGAQGSTTNPTPYSGNWGNNTYGGPLVYKCYVELETAQTVYWAASYSASVLATFGWIDAL